MVGFQPTLDIVGMVIYATELILWIGVFACGGYFNLAPWVRERMSARLAAQEQAQLQLQQQQQERERNGGIALHDLPSSTSVFRTVSTGDEGIVRRTQTGKVQA
jgi:hypothetical protein